MTWPITDEQIEDAKKVLWSYGWEMDKSVVRKALEAALDRRVGEKDRRKVRDAETAAANKRMRISLHGRRKDDAYDWSKLPLSEPLIPVSEGMRAAGTAVYLRSILKRGDVAAEEIYRAMESVRLKEAERRSMAPNAKNFLGDHLHRRASDHPIANYAHRRKDDPQ